MIEITPTIEPIFNYELIDRLIKLADIAVRSKTNDFELAMIREIQKISSPPFIFRETNEASNESK